jgi:hypothetical protein
MMLELVMKNTEQEMKFLMLNRLVDLNLSLYLHETIKKPIYILLTDNINKYKKYFHTHVI